MRRFVTAGILLLTIGERAEAVCDADNFVLKQPFKVGSVYPEYKRPEPDANVEVPELTERLLHDAFVLAPKFFQDRLCNVSGLYLSAERNVPWSFRELPKQFAPEEQPDTYNRYIAMPITPPPPLSVYENLIQTGLLDGWKAGSLTVNHEADNHVMTVLSALAHEDGHLLFRQTHAPIPGGDFKFERFCDGRYFRGSWKDPVDVVPGFGPFIVKGEHTKAPQIDDIKAAIKEDETHAAKLFAELMDSAHFINLWAAFSPEHDFVETYRIKVMTEARVPLQSIKLTMPGADPIDLIERLSGDSEVAHKFRCFDHFFR